MTAIETQERFRPEIVENYRDFEPPPNLKTSLDELLEAVPAKYLAGLKVIVLTNQAGLSRDERRQKTWSRNHKIRLVDARGWYQTAGRTSPARIHLCVDNILRSEMSWFRSVPILRYDALGRVLFHEIGHHIHDVHQPVFDGKESVAEGWSRRLFARFVRLRYWYLMPILYPASKMFLFVRRVSRKLGLRAKVA